jgi:hypothetical protein
MTGDGSPADRKDFSSSLFVQTGSDAQPASFPDHSTPYNAEVKDEQQLYFLSPFSPDGVAGELYLTFMRRDNSGKLVAESLGTRAKCQTGIEIILATTTSVTAPTKL